MLLPPDLTTRDVKRAHASQRAVGLIAAYIGGTPVEAYANDAALDTKTCVSCRDLAGIWVALFSR